MLNKSYKLLAIVLALSVLFSCLPMSIVALDVPNENVALSDVNEPEAYSSDVIVEDESLREENVKHFRMPDGSYTAVSYNKPVHRMDANGVWQDIDNSMTEAPVKNKQAFVTADGRTVFSKKINSNDPTVFELSENGYSIKVSFANADIKNATAKLSNHAKKYTPTNADDIETQYKKLKTIDNNTTVAYKNLLKGMTLEYVLSANDIKENIIVEKTNDSYAYTFIYELTGLTAVLNDDGSIVLLDETEQVPVYEIPAPYMYDANNATSDNVSYALSDLGNGTYELTVSADEAWINSSERAFPVVIDPTIYDVTLNVDAKDTYIDSNAPNTNFGESEKLWVSSQQITFMNFGELPRISKYATIHDAKLKLRYYYYISTGSLTVGLYQAIADWNEYSLTWNEANEHQFMGISLIDISTESLPADTSITPSNPGVAELDVKALVEKWYAGLGNYGIVLKYEGGTNSSVILTSRETYTYSYFEIFYTVNSAPIENGVYFLKNKQVDGYIQIDNGASTNASGAILELWDFDGASDQKWVFTYLHNGYYRITSSQNALTLTAPASKPESITLEYYQASPNQMWQITAAGNGCYHLTPASDSFGYLAVAEGIGSNGRNVKLRNSQSDNQDEWVLTKIQYVATVYNFYDKGYFVRYGESELTSISKIDSYMEEVSKQYLKWFGLTITAPTASYFESAIDICKEEVNSDNIDILCSHENPHTVAIDLNSADSAFAYFDDYTSPFGNDIITKVYWTGHRIQSSLGQEEYNRSFSYYWGVFMLELSSTYYRDRDSKGILMHELNHQYGAPDHYHEVIDKGLDTERCRSGDLCSECSPIGRPKSCIMNQSRKDITKKDIICEECKNDIYSHLEDHHK